MTDKIFARVLEAFGPDAVAQDAAGKPRVAPDSTEALARVMALAHAEGWRVRIEGRGSWSPQDAPAVLAVTTAALDRVLSVAPADLVATVEAGAAIGAVQQRLAADRAFLAWDPPGRPQRSLGSIVATGTAGPWRHRHGPVRDQLLGCAFVTGDGRIIRPGGTVVKNVAGYDLTRLMAGGFGAFGILTELHLRLRALPATDLTVIARGARDALTSIGRDLVAAGLDAAAMELFSPAVAAEADWVLALRLAGPEAGVEAEAARLAEVAAIDWARLPGDQAGALWAGAAHAALAGDTTLRFGVLPDGIDDCLDLLADHLDVGLVSAGAGMGVIRWSGAAPVERLAAVRRIAAAREIPVTLERAPWPVRRGFGHFGLYREGVGTLVGRLRERFDPGGVFAVPLDSER